MKKDQPEHEMVPPSEVTDKKPDPSKRPAKKMPNTASKAELRIMHKAKMKLKRVSYLQHSKLYSDRPFHLGNLSRQHPNKGLPIPKCYNQVPMSNMVTYE